MTLGVCCSTNCFSYVIIDDSQDPPRIKKKEALSVPKSGPQGLVWMRKEIQEITTKHKVKRLAYKRCETIRRPKDERTWLEGVMMEADFSVGVQDIRGFLKRQIASAVAFKGKARYVA